MDIEVKQRKPLLLGEQPKGICFEKCEEEGKFYMVCDFSKEPKEPGVIILPNDFSKSIKNPTETLILNPPSSVFAVNLSNGVIEMFDGEEMIHVVDTKLYVERNF